MLVYISVMDFTTHKISNESILCLLFLSFLKFGACDNLQDVGTRLFLMLIIYFIIILLWAYGLYGGGDAKLLIVAFFWLYPHEWIKFYIFISVGGLIYIFFYYIYICIIQGSQISKKIAFGPCIALSWALMLIPFNGA